MLPMFARAWLVKAAVNNRPSFSALVAVAQYPKIDVVKRKRQSHANPIDAGRHLSHVIRRGQVIRQGVEKFFFVFVHEEVHFAS